MRIHYLAFEAIGPFAKRYEVDFDQLSAQGTFLLDGPTGSGKSMIIDAIVFALYGTVAGETSTKSRLRSSHVPDTQESWVDLVFSVASGTYRVWRSPEQTVVKKRGTGTRTRNAQAKLWRLSQSALDEHDWEAGEVLASQVAEAGTEISRIIGMNSEQFLQTVVLPQGQFAKFLSHSSRERQPILEAIFQTGSYQKFVGELQGRAKAAGAAIEEQFQDYREAIKTWLGNDAISDEQRQQITDLMEQALSNSATFDDSIDQELLNAIDAANSELHQRADGAQAEAAAAGQAAAEAREALERARALAERLDRRERLLGQAAELEARRPALVGAQAALRANQSAALPALRVADASAASAGTAIALTSLTSAVEAIADARADSQTAETATPSAHMYAALEYVSAESITETTELLNTKEPWQLSTQTLRDTALLTDRSAFNEHLHSLEQRIGQAREMASLEASIAARSTELAALEARSTDLASQLESLQATLKELPERRTALEAKLEQAQTQARTLDTIHAQLDKLDHLIDTAHQHQEAQALVTQAESTLERALTKHATTKTAHDAVTQRWINSLAAELSEKLDTNQPCPVCGSLDHPHPAEPTSDFASREDVDAAKAELDEAQDELTQSQLALTAARTRRDELSDRLKDRELSSLEAERTQVQEQEKQAQSASELAATLTKDLATLTKEQEEITTRVHKLSTEATEVRTKIETLTHSIESDSQRVAAARGEYATASALESALTEARDQFSLISEREKRAQQAIDALIEALDQMDSALESSDFDSAEQALAARLTEQESAKLTTELEEFAKLDHLVHTQLKEPEIAELTGKEDPELEPREAASTQAQQALASKQKLATQLAQAANTSSRFAAPVHKQSKAWHKAEKEAGPVTRLANLAAGGNLSTNSIPLNIWVLMQRFEVVVDRANEHLRRISGGRYELMRSDHSRKNQKTGLDLNVIDREGSLEGDEIRETSSLSGGETFYTSLALALALADVVQEEQGGTRIETLLIDEGFGTLSEDLREIVMRTLTDLTDNGRVVGIVSHVDQLKQLVANRISLTKSADGTSTLEVIS